MPNYPVYESQTHIEIRGGAIYQIVKSVRHESPGRSEKSYSSTFLGWVMGGKGDVGT